MARQSNEKRWVLSELRRQGRRADAEVVRKYWPGGAPRRPKLYAARILPTTRQQFGVGK
jgi:hypothetical protein